MPKQWKIINLILSIIGLGVFIYLFFSLLAQGSDSALSGLFYLILIIIEIFPLVYAIKDFKSEGETNKLIASNLLNYLTVLGILVFSIINIKSTIEYQGSLLKNVFGISAGIIMVFLDIEIIINKIKFWRQGENNNARVTGS